eukprot:246053_1
MKRSLENTEEIDNQLHPRKRLKVSINKLDRLIQTETGTFNGSEYRFGEYYFYCLLFQNNKHFVKPIFKSMQEEVTQNLIYKIPVELYNDTKTSAQRILDKMVTQCEDHNWTQDMCFKNFGIRLYARDHQYYNWRFNIKSGQQITIHHLVAVKLYFDNNMFCKELRKTYRKNENKNESLQNMKQRNANFAHTCKHICEAIYLYGNILPLHKRLYRGVTQIKFEYFNAIFSGPVSTTEDINVARRFAGIGSIMQLEPSEKDQMYIIGGAVEFTDQNCSSIRNSNNNNNNVYSLSSYSNEKEYLMWEPCMNITDLFIPLIQEYKHIKLYICAMRLFQKIVKGELISATEMTQLLSHDVQRVLHVLIQWRISKNIKELKTLMQLDIEEIKSKSAHIIHKESNIENVNDRITFITDLCGTVFENLCEKTKIFWHNINIILNGNLQYSVETLLTSMKVKGCEIFKSKIVEFKIGFNKLKSVETATNKYLPFNKYLKSVNSDLLNNILNCNEIMHCIGECCDDPDPIDYLYCGDLDESDWNGKMKYKNELYEINPLIFLIPTSCRVNNKYIDFVIQINKKELKGINSLQWSFDILCDELDICMYFGEKNAKYYSMRKYTQIICNDKIREFINDKKDMVWKVNFRFYHKNSGNDA